MVTKNTEKAVWLFALLAGYNGIHVHIVYCKVIVGGLQLLFHMYILLERQLSYSSWHKEVSVLKRGCEEPNYSDKDSKQLIGNFDKAHC